MKKQFVLPIALLLCLFTGVLAIAEKKERIIWMAAVVPSGSQYIMYSDFDGTVKRTPAFFDKSNLLQAIGCEPGVYFVVTKGYVRTTGRDRSRTLVDVMHYDGETYLPIIENLTLDHCSGFVAYLDGFLYYTKEESVVENGIKETAVCLMRAQKGMIPETVMKLPGTTDCTTYPILSERGDILYLHYNEERGGEEVVCRTAFDEETIADGDYALWMDPENILYVYDNILYCYNLKKKESHVFLDATGRAIQMPIIYYRITINKAKDTLAYFVERPQEELAAEYSEIFQGKPYTVSLITGEHQLVKGADYIGDNLLMTWWGE